MDEEISIINANTRNEQVKNFFIKYKNKIILTLLALAVLLIGAYSFDKYKVKKKKEFLINLMQQL